jgi:hypothetical protein
MRSTTREEPSDSSRWITGNPTPVLSPVLRFGFPSGLHDDAPDFPVAEALGYFHIKDGDAGVEAHRPLAFPGQFDGLEDLAKSAFGLGAFIFLLPGRHEGGFHVRRNGTSHLSVKFDDSLAKIEHNRVRDTGSASMIIPLIHQCRICSGTFSRREEEECVCVSGSTYGKMSGQELRPDGVKKKKFFLKKYIIYKFI